MSFYYRMVPDIRKGGGAVTLHGKVVPVAANTFIDVPLETASLLNGWVNCGKVGTTANRPVGTSASERYIDTTLNKVIISDGFGNWHDPLTGALV